MIGFVEAVSLASLIVSIAKIFELFVDVNLGVYRWVREFKKDLQNLLDTLETIQDVLAEADAEVWNRRGAKTWLRQLTHAAYDAEDLLDKIQIYLSRQHQVRKLSRKLYDELNMKDVLERFDRIANRRQLVQHVLSPDQRSKPRETGSQVDESAIVGRQKDKENIIDMLITTKKKGKEILTRAEDDTEDSITIIPIVGMPGLGKTTVVQCIYNDTRVTNHFGANRRWVDVGVNFDLSRILREMMKDYNKDSPLDAVQDKFKVFIAGKKFLVVLDNVWTENYQEWALLQQNLKHAEKGSRVLVTTQKTNLPLISGMKSLPPLDNLSKDECWSLFKITAFPKTDLSFWESVTGEQLEKIGRDIVEKCGRLALAVKAMAAVLCGNVDQEKWKKVLNSEIWLAEKQSTEQPMILPALQLSYNHLSSELRTCFVYCSLFPTGYLFNKDELVQLWMASDLIQPQERQTISEVGIGYFNKLLTRSFFQGVNFEGRERYTMHTLVHQLAESISGPYFCRVTDDMQCNLNEKTRRASLICKNVNQPVMEIIAKSNNLRVLLTPSGYLKDFGNTLDKMFKTIRYMRALDLSSSTVSELPKSIKHLKLLRYINLSGTRIEALPNSICSLYNLQTLKLSGCLLLSELPKDFRKLVNLRHLELDEKFWYQCTMLPPGMGSLTSLQNLCVYRVHGTNGYQIGELKSMDYLTGKLHILMLENAVNALQAQLKTKKNLRKLVLEWGDGNVSPENEEAEARVLEERDVASQDAATEELEERNVAPPTEATQDRLLQVRNVPQGDATAADERVLEELQPHPNLKKLQIFCYSCTKLPTWMTHRHLPNLVTLSMKNCAKCKVLSLGGLSHLKKLKIKGMQDLEEILVSEDLMEKFPQANKVSLDVLKIVKCPNLRKLSSFSKIRDLKIKGCNSLKALPVTQSLIFVVLMGNRVLEDWNEMKDSFSELLELKIDSCPMLQALPQVFKPTKVEISGCRSLRALLAPKDSQQLMHLLLDQCEDGTLVGAIPESNSLDSLVISNVSKATYFPKWPYLPGLKVLHILRCKDLVSLSQEASPFQGLPSLKTLSIRGCPQLVRLPGEGLPTTLEFLSISSCTKLTSLGPKYVLKSLTNLNDLHIENCPKLKSLPEDGVSTSLQHFFIGNCPILMERCKRGGPDWSKIKHIPDLEIKLPSSASKANPKPSSTAWYQHFIYCHGAKWKGKGSAKPSSLTEYNSSWASPQSSSNPLRHSYTTNSSSTPPVLVPLPSPMRPLPRVRLIPVSPILALLPQLKRVLQQTPIQPATSEPASRVTFVDPIPSNADCRHREFHNELYYDFRAFFDSPATRDSTLLCQRYFLKPFMVPRPYYYHRVVMDFYQTMTSRGAQRPKAIHFEIDGRPGILTAVSIADALGIPTIPFGAITYAPWSDTSAQEMVQTLAGGRATYPTCILSTELPPHLLLVDHVLRSNFFPCQHIVQRRGEILDALYRISQKQWFSPAHLVMSVLLYFEKRVHIKKLQRASRYPLFFPRLLSTVLEHQGFPSEPHLERKRHCSEVFTVQGWQSLYSSSELASLSASTEHHYTSLASLHREMMGDDPNSPITHLPSISDRIVPTTSTILEEVPHVHCCPTVAYSSSLCCSCPCSSSI